MGDVVDIFRRIADTLPAKLPIGWGWWTVRRWVGGASTKVSSFWKYTIFGKQDAVRRNSCYQWPVWCPLRKKVWIGSTWAMACEVPVINSNAGGIPEVNIDGVTDLWWYRDVILWPKNALKLLQNPELLQQFRKMHSIRQKKFDINKYSSKIM